eukprot:TRINITY_DN22258_c0_g2_i1.p1 TRINITY_DN22258_c0_g2~~TRINITY_DN22258_c0_g2_i1.p1  ORF type:complete len:392 (+),score=95.54 TRINITY_DN22258_c0_g2_i1:106-1281(+)
METALVAEWPLLLEKLQKGTAAAADNDGACSVASGRSGSTRCCTSSIGHRSMTDDSTPERLRCGTSSSSRRWADTWDADWEDQVSDVSSEVLSASASGQCASALDLQNRWRTCELGRALRMGYTSEGGSSARLWRPNLEAPEFIPTMTNYCPLVGVWQVACDEAVAAPLLEVSDEPTAACSSSASAPAPPKRSSLPAACAGHSPRLSAEEEQRAARRERSWTPSANFASLGQEGSLCRLDDDDRCISQEEWRSRIEARRKALELVYATHEYQAFLEARKLSEAKGVPLAGVLAPEPEDRSLSRRQWKQQVTQLRGFLRKWYNEEWPGSEGAASTTDGLWAEGSSASAAETAESCCLTADACTEDSAAVASAATFDAREVLLLADLCVEEAL